MKPPVDEIRRILVIKLRYIGDVLLSVPVAASLKRGLPGAEIVFLVNEGTEGVLENCPYVSEVLRVSRCKGLSAQWRLVQSLRARRFDLAVDLTDGDRAAILCRLSGARYRVGFNHERRWRGLLYDEVVRADREHQHVVRYHLNVLDAVGCKPASDFRWISPAEADFGSVRRSLAGIGLEPDRPFVVFHAGARHWFKAWPPERFSELARRMVKELGLAVLVAGGTAEAEAAAAVASAAGPRVHSMAGKLTLLELAALVKQARFFVGNDAGPMHIAAAVGTPVVALFGPTSPIVWGPVGEGHRVLWKQMDCTDCWHYGCRRGEENCMRRIRVDEVFEACRRIGAGPGANG